MTSSSHREESFEQESSIGGPNSGEKGGLKELQLNFFSRVFELPLKFTRRSFEFLLRGLVFLGAVFGFERCEFSK
jgi:hypothetical protein